jgi:transcriptional regulator
VEALAIFGGPDHYIAPRWYPEKEESGRVVPTWNYAVVHAYGTLRIVQDAVWLREMLDRLTAVHEAGSAAPWQVSDAPEEYIAGLLKRIVGVEIPITRIEGKWKLDQKESVRSREAVAAGLAEVGTAESLAMKELMEETFLE